MRTRGLSSSSSATSSGSRGSKDANAKKPPTSASKFRFYDGKIPLCLQYSQGSKSRTAALYRNGRKQTKSTFLSSLSQLQKKLVEWLLTFQCSILDFVLQPVDRLFPELPAQQPSATCCRCHSTVNRSKSSSLLAVKTRSLDSYRMARRFTQQRRTASESHFFS
ncbi:hypothetical protein M3Y99_01833300 [Aphelenchoides fujianensis]|nr:hypothetical protein M3Y99_01833300 [Aphelenchoides fujianensis]